MVPSVTAGAGAVAPSSSGRPSETGAEPLTGAVAGRAERHWTSSPWAAPAKSPKATRPLVNKAFIRVTLPGAAALHGRPRKLHGGYELIFGYPFLAHETLSASCHGSPQGSTVMEGASLLTGTTGTRDRRGKDGNVN